MTQSGVSSFRCFLQTSINRLDRSRSNVSLWSQAVSHSKNVSGKIENYNSSRTTNLEGKILAPRYYLSNSLKKFPVNAL